MKMQDARVADVDNLDRNGLIRRRLPDLELLAAQRRCLRAV